MAFCNDCTNLNDSSGSGLGTVVFQTNSGVWKTLWGQAAGTGAQNLTVAGNLVLNGTVTAAGSAAGVTCSGSPTGSFATVNGIVTHC
jgi:hypothetical protein